MKLIALFLFTFLVLGTLSGAENQKPRIINMTDLGADPDDIQSMVRFLVQSNEFDVEGLIVTTGCWKKTQSNVSMLTNILNAYGQAVDNLSVHDSKFPSLDYLKSISVLGQKGYGMADVGAGKDSPGSELIIKAVDKDDPRPVWICFWGGGNTLAQALWKVQNTRTEAALEKFVSKIRVYDVLGQDNAGTWIAKTFPNMLYIRATSVYGWQPPKNGDYQKNDIQSHGPLGAIYPDTKYATEGDTPAFLHVFPNGLNNPDEVWQGGWGGRFDRKKKADIRGMSCMSGEDAKYDTYYMYGNTSTGASDISRWSVAYNNDFAARMDWSIKSSYADANHHPIAIVNGDSTKQVIEVVGFAGNTIQLSAKGSFDPDSNALSYRWFYYSDPGTYSKSITIQNSTSTNTSIAIPSDASGKEIHIVLELKDSGQPALYAYRRVVVKVVDPSRLRVMVSTDLPSIPVTNSDPDGVQSMVRFLLYSNEFDVEGLIASAGDYEMFAQKKNIHSLLDKYDLVDEILRKKDVKFPTADALRAVTYEGLGNNHNIKMQWGCDKQPWADIIGEGKDSEASDAIIAAADRPDPRPLYIGVLGGAREVAQSIWKVTNTRSQAEVDAFISKLRIFLIDCQDATHQWLMSNYPNLFIVESKTTYQGMFYSDNKAWVTENIIKNHGPLCAIYPPSAIAGDGVVEGGSPVFLYLVSANRGINNPDDPTQPSWGGQYVRVPGTNHYVDSTGGSSISKWKADFQAEFKERADWCVENVVVQPDDKTAVWLEAECGTVGSLWDITSDFSASNGKFITVKAGNNSTANAPAENGVVTYDFNISESGTYTLWARVITPSANDDSFWLKMGNDAWYSWNNILSSDSWVWASSQSYSLSVGTHTLSIGYREDGARLDKLYFTQTSTTPMGDGESAGNCSGETGMNSALLNNGFSVYPNPANDNVLVRISDVEQLGGELTICRLDGTLVQVVGDLKDYNYIDVSSWSAGQYFFCIETHCSRICEKIIVK